MSGGDYGNGITAFLDLPKSALLHQSKAFHATQLDIDLCSNLLTAILYQLAQGEEYTPEEKTGLFFACTKLFQSKNIFVRRLVYCLIRALQPTPEDTIIIISCLSRDINNTTVSPVTMEIYRSNSIRLLFSLVDDTMIQNIERLLTQNLIGDVPITIKSALIATQHVYRYSPDSLRRWKAEIQKSLNHNDQIIRYHALSLTLKMVSNDPIAAQRFITTNLKQAPSHGKRALPTILNIRVIARAMANTPGTDPLYPVEYMEFLRDTLGDDNNTGIQLESAKTILQFLQFSKRQEYFQFLQYTTGVLMQILTKQSSTIVHKFATLRMLNDIAQKRTQLLSPHTDTIDQLLSGGEANPLFQNRNLTMYAVNLSLKAGNDQNIDLFLSSLETILISAPDDNKISVLLNIRDYVLYKNQSKYIPIVSFMALLLKYENRFVIKNTIITCYQSIMSTIPHSVPFILDLIAEHIEDSEYPRVTIRIINLISQYAYLHPQRPEKYLRFLFNRTILETSAIRAAAVSAIMRIAITLGLQYKTQLQCGGAVTDQQRTSYHKVQSTVIALLSSVCYDHDDEVRDRACLYLDILKRIKALGNNNINNQLQLTQQALALFTNSSFPVSKATSATSSQSAASSSPSSHINAKNSDTVSSNNSDNNNNNNDPNHNLHLPIFVQVDSYDTFPSYSSRHAANEQSFDPYPVELGFPHQLPNLDILESSVLAYLQSNFNINTTATTNTNTIGPIATTANAAPTTATTTTTALPTTTPQSTITPIIVNSSVNNTGSLSLPSTSQLAPIPNFGPFLHYSEQQQQPTHTQHHEQNEPNNVGVFDPTIHSTEPIFHTIYTTLQKPVLNDDSPNNPKASDANNQGLTHSLEDENKLPTYNELKQRLPANINRFLTQHNITNYWQCRHNLTNTSPNQTSTPSQHNNSQINKVNSLSTTSAPVPVATATTTEFPYKLNQYSFQNGSILFETIITHNFKNAAVSSLFLQIDELKAFHDQGHVQIQCMSLMGNDVNPITNEIVSAEQLNQQGKLNHILQYGKNITIYTLFTIKNINLLVNLCSVPAYTFRLQYVIRSGDGVNDDDVDDGDNNNNKNVIDSGDVERGQYQLLKLSLMPTLFSHTPEQHAACINDINTANMILPTLNTFDYRAVWDSIPAQPNPQQPQLTNEISMSFTIQLDPQNTSKYKDFFIQQLDSVLNNLRSLLSIVPIQSNFNIVSAVSAINTPQLQLLIPLYGIYLTQDSVQHLNNPQQQTVQQPTRILCRIGGMLQAENNCILIRIMLKTHNPHVTKLFASLVKV